MKTLSLMVILAMILSLSAGNASAARFVEEHFNYPDVTQLNGQAATATGLSGTWGGWRNPSDIITSNSSLTYGLLQTANRQLSFDYPGYGNGDNARCLFDPSATTRINLNGTSAWYSLILRTPPTYQSTKVYKIRFDRGNNYDMYGVRLNGSGTFQAYVGTTLSSASSAMPTGTNLLVVFKVQRTSGSLYDIEAWLYNNQIVPATEPTPGTGYAVTGGIPPSGSDVQALMFVMDTPGGSGQRNAAVVDEFRGGDTFADVTPVPEPAALALLALGGLLLRKQF